VFNAVIKYAASNATKCTLDIPPHIFLMFLLYLVKMRKKSDQCSQS